MSASAIPESTKVVTMDNGFDDGSEGSYRVVSKAAVLSLAIGLVSVVALVSVGMLAVPAVGLAFGLLALRAIRLYPDEVSGKVPAWMGVLLSGVLLASGATLHTYLYLTELPEGYERYSFQELQPDKEFPELPIPPSALEMNGRKIFIKGYVHPGVQGAGPVDRFVLVPDMGTCCFGGQPKLTDMIDVKLINGDSLSYSMRKRSLKGVFTVDPRIVAPDGSQGACYRLVAELVR
ncbi:MAG: DUF3299 domain-containing protein [Planctomycetota bacterium]